MVIIFIKDNHTVKNCLCLLQ